jgi:outer membrane protein assembly factor BamE (lipoprotein component of BamABCDE complex)
MRARWMAVVAGAALFCVVGFAARADSGAAAISPSQVAKIVPGQSTKADVQTMLGTPWRVVQFNDCGMAMDGQADETWDYRGTDPTGGFRLHVEFGDNGVVHLIAKIPDGASGGQPTAAKVAPDMPGMSM